jgi:hypothetical protein
MSTPDHRHQRRWTLVSTDIGAMEGDDPEVEALVDDVLATTRDEIPVRRGSSYRCQTRPRGWRTARCRRS